MRNVANCLVYYWKRLEISAQCLWLVLKITMKYSASYFQRLMKVSCSCIKLALMYEENSYCSILRLVETDPIH